MDSGLFQSEAYQNMVGGELYFPSTPELVTARDNSVRACKIFNAESHISRRRQVELWRRSDAPEVTLTIRSLREG